MTHRTFQARRALWSPIALAALVCAAATGCASHDSSPTPDVNASYANLAGGFSQCEQAVKACVQNAKGDQTALQACRTQAQGCVSQAQAAAQSLRNAIQACFSAAAACAAADAGTSDAGMTCREQLHACLVANRPPVPPVPPCLQQLHQCIEAGKLAPADAGSADQDDADGGAETEHGHPWFGISRNLLNTVPMCVQQTLQCVRNEHATADAGTADGGG